MLHVLLLLKRFAHTLRKDRLDRVLLALLVITLVGMLGIAYFDSLSFADSLWWAIVTITTVGYGDISPVSLGGRIVGALLMLFGIGFLGMLTATLASTLLLVRASLDHGVTQIITELVSSRFGSEIYKMPPPQACVGQSFLDVLSRLKADRDIIVLAVESKQEGRFLANPPNSYIIDEKDRLIVVGKDRPV